MNCSLPGNFKYGVRDRFGSVEVTHINGAPTLTVGGKTIYKKPVTKTVGSNYLQVVDPHSGVTRTDTDDTKTPGESYVDRSLAETLGQTEHILLNTEGFDDDESDEQLTKELNDNPQWIKHNLNGMDKVKAETTDDNVFTVEADVEPLPTSRTIPDIIVTSMDSDMRQQEGKIQQKMPTVYGRSASDNTYQTSISKEKTEILSKTDRSKSEPHLEKSSFPILHSIKQLFRKKNRPKSSTLDDEMRSQTPNSYFGISKFFLPKPKKDHLFRSQSVEEGEREGTPLEELRAFSDGELEYSPTFSPEMMFKRHTKKHYHFHCVSWNELSESQKGENVEISVHGTLERIHCEKPRMMKGMSIEHLDKIIIRRANSGFMEKRKKRRSNDRKSQSLNEKTLRENTGNTEHVELKRSVSDPCISCLITDTKLETQTFDHRRSRKSKKSKRSAKGKGHVCFVDFTDLQSQVHNHTNVKDKDVTRRPQDLPDIKTSFHENDRNSEHYLCDEDVDTKMLSPSPEENASLQQNVTNAKNMGTNVVSKNEKGILCWLPRADDLGSDELKLSANSRLVGSHSYPDIKKQLTCLTEGLQENRHQDYHSIDILDSVTDNCFSVYGRSNPAHQRFADPFYRERYKDSIIKPSVDENGIKETFI